MRKGGGTATARRAAEAHAGVGRDHGPAQRDDSTSVGRKAPTDVGAQQHADSTRSWPRAQRAAARGRPACRPDARHTKRSQLDASTSRCAMTGVACRGRGGKCAHSADGRSWQRLMAHRATSASAAAGPNGMQHIGLGLRARRVQQRRRRAGCRRRRADAWPPARRKKDRTSGVVGGQTEGRRRR